MTTLLAMPAELRNQIWHELLTPKTTEPFNLSNGHMEPALLSVNRQIRTEARGIFYANNLFQFSDPKACVRCLTSLPQHDLDLISEIRYDTTEICTDNTSWKQAFKQIPGVEEDKKLELLKQELSKSGVKLRDDVLKAKVVIACRPSWTSNPLAAALDAVKSGFVVGRMMFI